jgi:hypothetical protein
MYGISIHRPQTKNIVGEAFYGEAISGDHRLRGTDLVASRVLGAQLTGKLLGTGRIESTLGHKISPFDDLTWEPWITVDNAGTINQRLKDIIFGIKLRCADFFSLSCWSIIHQPAGERPGLGKILGSTTVSTIAAPTEMRFKYRRVYWKIDWPAIPDVTAYRLWLWDGSTCNLAGEPVYRSTIVMQPEDGSDPEVYLLDSKSDQELIYRLYDFYKLIELKQVTYPVESELKTYITDNYSQYDDLVADYWTLDGLDEPLFALIDERGKTGVSFIDGFASGFFSTKIYPIAAVEIITDWSACFPFCSIPSMTPWHDETLNLAPYVIPAGQLGFFGEVDVTFVPAGGTAPYAFELVEGDIPLPATLSFDESTGKLTGYVALIGGDIPFTIIATDVNNCNISRDYILRIVVATEVLAFNILTPAEDAEFASEDDIVVSWEEPLSPTAGLVPQGFSLIVKDDEGNIVYTHYNAVTVYVQSGDLTHTIPGDTLTDEGDYTIEVFAIYPES